MIKTFDTVQTVGAELARMVQGDGIILFKVISVEPDCVKIRSKSVDGYTQIVKKETFEKDFNDNIFWFETIAEGRTYTNRIHAEHHDKLVADQVKDKDAFINNMIQIAYASKTDPDYGNWFEAKVIKDAVKILFPEIKL